MNKILFLTIFICGTSFGAITVDSRNSGTSSASSVTTISWSHTVGAISNGILVVMSASAGNIFADRSVQSIVWDSGGANTPLTRLITKQPTSPIIGEVAEIWYLNNPSPGTKTILVTYNNASLCGGSSVSYAGVDLTNPWRIATGESAEGMATNPSLTLTSGNGDMTVDSLYLGSGSGTATPGAGQTQIGNSGALSGSFITASSDEPSVGSSNTMSWTASVAPSNWIDVGGSLQAAAPYVPKTQVLIQG